MKNLIYYALCLLLTPALEAAALPFSLRLPAFNLYPRHNIKDCSRAQPGCTCQQITFSLANWTVTDLDFHSQHQITTPGQPSSFGHISFNLTNPAAGSMTRCAASSSRTEDFFYGDEIYPCGEVDAEGKDKIRGMGGTFRFDKEKQILAINQTWQCADVGGSIATFMGRGSTTIPMHCNNTLFLNSNWKMGQTYSLRTEQCGNTTFVVPWTEIMAMI